MAHRDISNCKDRNTFEQIILNYKKWIFCYDILSAFDKHISNINREEYRSAISACRERSLRTPAADWTNVWMKNGLQDSTSNKPSFKIRKDRILYAIKFRLFLYDPLPPKNDYRNPD